MASNAATILASEDTATLADYWALTKPEVNFLIVIAALAGFYLACPTDHPFAFQRLIHTLLGTLLVASGAGALNQYAERRFDARMRRTARRPLAAGRLSPVTALSFGILLSISGVTYLLVAVNVVASLLAALTLKIYLFLYTPLKRRTPLCTSIGAVPGAMPPLIGWAAASGSLSGKAWILYAVLFLWQFPHFMAIARIYREDYARAGYLVLPDNDREETFMAWFIMAPSLALLFISVAAMARILPCLATIFLGSALCYYGARLVLLRSRIAARQLLRASIIYLPLQLSTLALAGF
jgi:protoheme IX farnesyltransferase